MREASIQTGDFNTRRWWKALAVLSVIFAGVLASAPLRPFFSEWRGIQQRYNTLAQRAGTAQVALGVQQIWKPALGVTDRCVTCHLGMGTAPPVPGEKLFQAHPPIPHDPKEFGCTVCHGGQGRATTKQAAHGFVSHWDEQMLEAQHLAAGCGACHNSASPNATWIPRTELARGRQLIESLDCLSCHKLDGKGRGNAADLSFAGIKGFKSDWHAWHLNEQAAKATPEWKASYGPIGEADVARLSEYLRTRFGAPRVVEAQALALERGCLGCHKIGGRGGEEGPVLDEVGRKPVGDLNFAGVKGEETLVNYLRRHFLDPAAVVPGSLMPQQAVTLEEADLLTSYALFLRARRVPPEFTPKDRLKRERLGEPTPPLSGAQAFQAFCSGCHGATGAGRNYGNLDLRFPAIGSTDFLDVAPDALIESTVKTGRPGRRMPGLAAAGGSLSETELKALIAHLRGLRPPPPALAELAGVAADPALGAQVYRQDCAACHGAAGAGTELGSPLASADNKTQGNRAALYEAVVNGVANTAMPRYTGYDARTLAALLNYVATLPRVATARANWKLGEGQPERGQPLFAKHCAGCHGDAGQGKLGPALANPAFLSVATANYLAATITRGRTGTPMPGFGHDNVNYPKLSASEILDLAAYIRGGLAAQKSK